METIIINLSDGQKREYVKGIKLKEVIETLKNIYPHGVVCGKFNNQIVNYEDTLIKSGDLTLYDINTKQGNKI